MNKFLITTMAIVMNSSMVWAGNMDPDNSIATSPSSSGSISFPDTPTGATGAALNYLNEEQALNRLYSDGLVVPNQPLQLSDEVRERARVVVQAFVQAQSKGGAKMRRDEREILNAILFNYGLQYLDTGEVIMLDLYRPDNYVPSAVPSLSPTVPMPDGAVVISRENVEKLHQDAVASRQKKLMEDKNLLNVKQGRRSNSSTYDSNGQNNLDMRLFDAEFNY